MREREVYQDLNVAEEILREKDLLVDTNPNLSKRFSIVQMPLSLNDYVEHILKGEMYTFLLYDGSSIQVGYQFDKHGQVTSHKLAFFFSPLSLPALRTMFPKLKELLVSREDLIEFLTLLPEYLKELGKALEGYEKVISSHQKEAWQELTWIHGVRLDYNSTALNPANHPQSHATLFDNDCRIAVSDYFDLRRFFLLIFAHLWPFHKEEVVPAIQQKIPPRSGTQSLIPSNYPQDYGVFFSF